DNMCVGYVSFAIGANRHNVMFRKARGQEQPFAIANHGGHELLRWPIDHPMATPRAGIVADHGLAARKHHLGAAIEFANDRCDVATDAVVALLAPSHRTCGSLER